MNEKNYAPIQEIIDEKAEAGVIATLTVHPEYIVHSPKLKPSDFHDHDSQAIFWAIRELYKTDHVHNMTAENIETKLASNAAVEEHFKTANIPDMAMYLEYAEFAARDSVEEYKMLVNSVLEMAFKRAFLAKSQQWSRMCMTTAGLADMSQAIYKDLSSMTNSFLANAEIETLGAKAKTLYQRIKERKSRGEVYGLPSVFPSLNKFFTYEEGELIVISARMKTGKSWLAMIEALHKARSGVPTFVQDSEMADENWYIRLLSYISGVPVARIKNCVLAPEEEALVDSANEEIESLPLYHNFDPYITREAFYAIIAQKKAEVGLKFVVWDYIKCSDDILSASERSAYMGAMTNFLKNEIAGDLGMSVLAFAQLNRGGEVAESDGIEKFCSVSVRWMKKTDDDIVDDGPACGTHKLQVRLNRLGAQHSGEKDYIDMMFSHERVGIEEAKQHKEANPYD